MGCTALMGCTRGLHSWLGTGFDGMADLWQLITATGIANLTSQPDRVSPHILLPTYPRLLPTYPSLLPTYLSPPPPTILR